MATACSPQPARASAWMSEARVRSWLIALFWQVVRGVDRGLVMQHVIRRTITEADNIGFTTMTMNPAWLHLDADYAANETEFGKPLVNRC